MLMVACKSIVIAVLLLRPHVNAFHSGGDLCAVYRRPASGSKDSTWWLGVQATSLENIPRFFYTTFTFFLIKILSVMVGLPSAVFFF